MFATITAGLVIAFTACPKYAALQKLMQEQHSCDVEPCGWFLPSDLMNKIESRRLAATMLILIPFVAVGGAIQLKIMAGFQGEGLKYAARRCSKCPRECMLLTLPTV
jgi:hypothetical protein